MPAEQVLEQNTSGGDKIDVKIDQKGAQEFWHGDPGDPDYQITKIVLHLSRDKDEPDGDLSFSLEVWPESHWPCFLLIKGDGLRSYTA